MTHRRTISGSARGQYAPLHLQETPTSPIDLSERDLAGNPVTSPILSTRPRSLSSRSISSPPGPLMSFVARYADSRNLFILLLAVLICGYWTGTPNDTTLTEKEAEEAAFTSIDSISSALPWGLEQTVLQAFDAGVADRTILYDDNAPDLVNRPDSFPFLFRTTPSLVDEPLSHKQNYGAHLATFGSYTLRLPQLTSHRPLLYLSPTNPQPSTADLTPEDVVAALSVMRAFKQPMLATYSVGLPANPADEKTMRIFAAPADFPLWPEQLDSDFFIAMHLPLPFRAYGLRLPENADARAAAKALHRLLAETKKTLVKESPVFFPREKLSRFARERAAAEQDDEAQRRMKMDAADDPANTRYAYTILLHEDWMVAIPRREPGPAINGMGAGRAAPPEVLLGIVSVATEEQKGWWGDVGFEAYLGDLGFPPLPPDPERPGKKEEELRPGEKMVLDMIEESKRPPGPPPPPPPPVEEPPAEPEEQPAPPRT